MGLCQPEDDPAVMMAFFITQSNMEAYSLDLQRKDIEKASRKGKVR